MTDMEPPPPDPHGDERDLAAALHLVYQDIEARYQTKDSLAGAPTGFYDLDHILGGLRPGGLYVLAGRPAMGRTALALELARGCAQAHAPALYYTAEMSRHMLVTRMLGARAQIDGHRLRTGYLTEKDWGRLNTAVGELADLPLTVVDDPGFTLADLHAEAMRLRAERGGLGLVVVDPVEMLRGQPAGGDDAGAQRTAHGLKRLARELETAVVAIAPIATAVEHRRDPRPKLADVRGGEALVELADVVLLLYRDAYYHPDSPRGGAAEVTVARNRLGPVGHVELFFDPNTQRFASISAQQLFEA